MDTTNNYKSLFKNFNHELALYGWNIFMMLMLESKDNTILTSDILRDLIHLKYNYNNTLITYGDATESYDPAIKTLQDLSMITSSVTFDHQSVSHYAHKLTNLGKQYVNIILPKTWDQMELPRATRDALRKKSLEDHNLTSRHPWQNHHKFFGVLAFIIMGSISSYTLISGKKASNVFSELTPLALIAVLFLSLIVGLIVNSIIGSQLEDARRFANADYMMYLSEYTDRYQRQYLKQHHGTKKDFIMFLLRNNRWRACLSKDQSKTFDEVNRYMF